MLLGRRQKEIRFPTLFFVLVLKTSVFLALEKNSVKESFTFFYRTNSYTVGISSDLLQISAANRMGIRFIVR
jgi:hypothetical protein